MDTLITIGQIVNTHGIRGEVKVKPATDFIEERFKKGNKLYINFNGNLEEHEVANYRIDKNMILVKIKGLDNINDVEKYKGSLIQLETEKLHELEEDEFYYHQLLGCKVYDQSDNLIGEVKKIKRPGASEILVIGRDGQKDCLIPFVNAFIKDVNITDKIIKIEVIEGLV